MSKKSKEKDNPKKAKSVNFNTFWADYKAIPSHLLPAIRVRGEASHSSSNVSQPTHPQWSFLRTILVNRVDITSKYNLDRENITFVSCTCHYKYSLVN